jgi:predicted GNAT family N-acyltransferase/SAM-dependent methyltransferase
MRPRPVRRHTEVIRERVRLRGRQVLEIGCGRGAMLRWLARQGAAVCGLDPQPAALAVARELEESGRLVAGHGEALPFATASFDLVLFFNSLHHLPAAAMPTALAESGRLLRPGGDLIVIEPLAEGDYFELLRPVEDETEVRAAARAALAGLGPGPLKAAARLDYVQEIAVSSVEALLQSFLAAEPARAPSVARAKGDLVRRFAVLGRPAEQGRRFDQPVHFEHWRRTAGLMPVVGDAILATDRMACFAIRRAVFVEEQGVPLTAEFDEHDRACGHLLARAEGQPVGTLRWRAVGDRVKVERVAVLPPFRGGGIGGALLRTILARLEEEGVATTFLHAQLQAERFYAGFGFAAEGTPFLEDGILHIRMVRRRPL